MSSNGIILGSVVGCTSGSGSAGESGILKLHQFFHSFYAFSNNYINAAKNVHEVIYGSI